ncbi:kynurenine/alpha-aminoadipate aminotransferase [Coprinopsis cinerea okayama7|uniref:Kynurenine/alpha-aminoadipate aminotransferase n=1 Tax=Coprinopsis cinerea (strain Okayama-7 / 130 / ATCC MYA-4618 / FGSC 9003) TaxID=240176 RepID=D6RPR8_COPC7|nr:kynurenine/alpha-aminoadipate aminotransferase [Coprinopsis cinerea okayama7\|eukprot:XP_002910512.1 kynurenine/alpha-aminoadipate aminotransferase [Coprinopsis cinerea okayama7\
MAEEGHMQESTKGKVPSSPPGPSQTLALPPTFYADKLSNAAKARKPCPIGSKSGILSMVLGQPNPSTFPFEKLTIQVKPTTAAGAGDDNVRDVTTNLVLELQEELEVALQYGQTAGVTELVEWIQEMMSDVHARKYDLIIIEDDPYYFLYYGNLPRPPSYFSLERELGGELGRVLRLDSFSKVLAPGFRLGWATGPRELLDAIERHNSISVAQASTFSQIITLKLLREWGLNGFLAHTRQIAEVYKKRRTVFNAYLERHLSGLAEWRVPDASMYFWVKLNLLTGKSLSSFYFTFPSSTDRNDIFSPADSSTFIREKAISNGVLVLPGQVAYPDGRTTAFVRVAFGMLSDEDMEEAVRRLAKVLKEEER